MTTTSKRPVLVLGLTLAALALGGCGGSDDAGHTTTRATSSAQDSSSGDSPSAASPSDGTGSVSPAPSQQAVSPSTPTAAAGPGACRTSDLRAALEGGEGAAGSTFFELRLRNVSAHACRTGGFGGVSFVTSPTGSPIGAPADRTNGGQARQLTLKPGSSARATLRQVNADDFPAGKCRPTPATGLRVYPPNQTASLLVRHAAKACRAPGVHLLSLSPYRLAP